MGFDDSKMSTPLQAPVEDRPPPASEERQDVAPAGAVTGDWPNARDANTPDTGEWWIVDNPPLPDADPHQWWIVDDSAETMTGTQAPAPEDEAFGSTPAHPDGKGVGEVALGVEVALVDGEHLGDTQSVARRQDRLATFSEGILPHLAVLGVFAVLLLAEPDFGTTAVLFCVAFALLFVAGAGLRHLEICAAVAAPVGVFLVWHSRYRLDRMLAFLDPWADPRGRGYQAVESLLAFGAGGGFGVGLGASSQKLFFLPAAHNDFILSIIGEELGFAGVAAVLVLFAVLVWRGIRAAHAAADAEACFVALGLTFLLAAQVLVNAGMALSLLPTKGIALPFLSYGISSVVSSSLAAGILLSVSGGTGGFLRRPVGGRR